ncbi:MAG TPA: YbdK family carboxylate-amine ligase [Burkholderiales bacterium]|nr:YbdK family carboxylate-amine ligase [Burkholderiales bacterium]
MSLAFSRSEQFTLGVELELQILSTHDYNLMRGSRELLALLDKAGHPGDVKPEITESMIEISTSVHRRYGTLAAELAAIRDAVVRQARRLNLALAGGGAHPFQRWSEQRIFPRERFFQLHELYGYLAKQFTVFGQHIHIGVDGGDEAVLLTHLMARYIPHFIALSASSPFFQGVDTSFDSSRLNSISAFPLSGTMPFVRTWDEFNAYFDEMHDLGVVESMKDFYWDIRPKPEYGTIEIRVCDTPLTVERAAALAAYAQTLAAHLMTVRPQLPSQDIYRVYSFNRFSACRFGLEGGLIDAYARGRCSLKQDIAATLVEISPRAEELGTVRALNQIQAVLDSDANDATWLRDMFKATGSLMNTVRHAADLWAGTGALQRK